MIVDTFPINNELEMLACRLETMSPAVDYFVAVEADVDHQANPKPFHISDNLSRFSEWADKLIVVKATGLPTLDDDPDPWARELMQREYVLDGLREISGIDADTVVLHGDVDEICRPLHVRNVRPKFPKRPGLLPDGKPDLGFVTFEQRGHFFAVDWLYPDVWGGTVAGTVKQIMELGPYPFQKMRNTRNWNPSVMPDAGWHFSWLGGQEAALKKLGSFCHPEVAERTLHGLSSDRYLREGMHLDGRIMAPVDVEPGEWPAFIAEHRCPSEWFRPRGERCRTDTVTSPLAEMHAANCDEPSDINEHLPTLATIASHAQHVVELGARSGLSTAAWLVGLGESGGRLTSVDISPAPQIGVHANWEHIQGDDTDAEVMAQVDECDVLFIDTSHAYEHTLWELRNWSALVRPGGVIVCHDTELQRPWDPPCPPSDPDFPVKSAIEVFCAERGYRWVNRPNCWGLGIIEVA